MKRAFVAFAACMFVASVSQAAVVFHSWEGSAESWTNTNGNSSTTGVTHGEYSLVRNVPSGWNAMQGPYTADYLPGLLANNQLLVDVTRTEPVADGFFLQVQLYMQGAGFSPATLQTPSINIVEGTQTIALDYSHVTIPADSGWQQFRIITNTNLPEGMVGTLYFDNLRAIPEPASLGLLALSGLAMIRRRRA